MEVENILREISDVSNSSLVKRGFERLENVMSYGFDEKTVNNIFELQERANQLLEKEELSI